MHISAHICTYVNVLNDRELGPLCRCADEFYITEEWVWCNVYGLMFKGENGKMNG